MEEAATAAASFQRDAIDRSHGGQLRGPRGASRGSNRAAANGGQILISRSAANLIDAGSLDGWTREASEALEETAIV